MLTQGWDEAEEKIKANNGVPSHCGGPNAGRATQCSAQECPHCSIKADRAVAANAAALEMEIVAALLDGATALHCAALRGNPAQVEHLLFCGGDVSMRTAAGELAIELVPVCWEESSSLRGKKCRCMTTADQDVWECRSQLARSLLSRRSFLSFSQGLLMWIRMLVCCVLCMLGWWGNHLSLQRQVSSFAL